ncbi:MAG: MFS transporter [Planctomycetaceae bacterium]
MSSAPPSAPLSPQRVLQLSLLFGALYFVQGIAEPSEGLISQPVRSMLRDWGTKTGDIASLMAWLVFPWTIKPLYGLLADFVPLGHRRRRNWLILATLTTTVGLSYVAWNPPQPGQVSHLLTMLLIPTIAVAFADVVTDSLMVEVGQPHGLTGRLQSVQWACLYGATILTGIVGGWLSSHKLQPLGFGLCAAAAFVSLMLALTSIPEPPKADDELPLRDRMRAVSQALRQPRFLAAAAFLFLWNFNPFSTAILQDYQVTHLKLGDQFYGNTVSVSAVASILACIAYGWYCPQVSVNALIHLSIISGILTTLLYLGLSGEMSGYLLAAITGFTYMTGSLVQLDLAARVCPPLAAGTVFALLMSLSNLGIGGGMFAGGWLHNQFEPLLGPHRMFDVLVLIGAAASTLGWLLYPWLKQLPEAERDQAAA